MNDLKFKKGIKEVVITKEERIYAYFRDLPKEEQKRIIEERTESYYSSGDNWYYELYIQPLWEDEVQLLKEKYDIDFDIHFECGSSYIYIRDIKVKPFYLYTKDNNEVELIFDYNSSTKKFDLDDYNIEPEDFDELHFEIIEKSIDLNKLCDDIEKLFDKFEHGLLYGVDDYLPEAIEQDLLESDEEFDIEVETKTLFSFEQEV